jgi:hypothetical protein
MEDGEREGVAVQERGMGVAGEAGGGADFHWDFGAEAHPRLSQASKGWNILSTFDFIALLWLYPDVAFHPIALRNIMFVSKVL